MNKLHLVILGFILYIVISKLIKSKTEKFGDNSKIINELNKQISDLESEITQKEETIEELSSLPRNFTNILRLSKENVDKEALEKQLAEKKTQLNNLNKIQANVDTVKINIDTAVDKIKTEKELEEEKLKTIEEYAEQNIEFRNRIEDLEKKLDPITYTNGVLTIDSKLKVTDEAAFGKNADAITISSSGNRGDIIISSANGNKTKLRGWRINNPDDTGIVIEGTDKKFIVQGNVIIDKDTEIKGQLNNNNLNTLETNVDALETNVDTLETDVDALETGMVTINSTIAPISTTGDTVKINANTVEFGNAGKVVIKGNDNNSTGKILIKSKNNELSTIRGWNNNTGIAIDGALHLSSNYIGSNSDIQFLKGIKTTNVDISQKLKLNNWELSGVDNKLNFNHNGETPMEFSAEADTEKQGIFIYKKPIENL